jgi:hypothetical protein
VASELTLRKNCFPKSSAIKRKVVSLMTEKFFGCFSGGAGTLFPIKACFKLAAIRFR